MNLISAMHGITGTTKISWMKNKILRPDWNNAGTINTTSIDKKCQDHRT